MLHAPTKRPLNARSLLLLGAVALVLMSWGCGQSMGARALPPLPRGVRAEVSEWPYVVTGTTVPEIRLSLRTAATAALGGSRVGLHRSTLDYSYQYGQQGFTCEVTNLSIELESAIQVPRWTDREAADSSLVAMWDTYITALRGHEYTHREYSYRHARDLSRALNRIESSTCGSIQGMVNSTAMRIRDQYRRLNEQFDEEYGTITWPPREFEAEARQARESADGLTTAEVDPNPSPTPATPASDDPVEAVDPSPADARESIEALGEEINRAASLDLSLAGRLGAVVTVHYLGSPMISEAFGQAHLDDLAPLRPDHLFAFPELTGVLLTVAARALDEAGTVDADAPIGDYLLNASRLLGQITLNQLLSSTSGLHNEQLLEGQSWEAAMNRLDDRALFTQPGAIVSYSRYSMPLAAIVVEEAARQPIQQLLSQTILDPLGMSRSTFDVDIANQLGRADAELDFDSVDSALPILFTTSSDIVSFLTGWTEGLVPGSDPFEDPAPGGLTSWGVGRDVRAIHMGMLVDAPGGVRRLVLSGGLGFGAEVHLFPETETVVVVWGTPASPSRVESVVFDAISSVLAAADPQRGLPSPGRVIDLDRNAVAPMQPFTGPLVPSDWAGRYVNGINVVLLVNRDGTLMASNYVRESPVTLRQDGRLSAPFPGFSLVLDAEGRRYAILNGLTETRAGAQLAYVHRDDAPRR